MCFLYRYYSCLIESNCKEALNKMLKFNQRFSEHLPLGEVIKATESAEKAYKLYCESLKENEGGIVVFENGEFKLKGYNYTNAKLIKLLKITLYEQKHLLVLIDTKEKYKRNNENRKAKRRNEKGLTKKQQELQDLKVKILELKDQGMSFRNIAEKLHISLGKVQRCVKK